MITHDLVNHPRHYNLHPSNVEAIEIIHSMTFNLGSAFKYIFRRDDKENAVQDLKKALWNVTDELNCRQKWGYTFMAKLSWPFYLISRQDNATRYWERTTLVLRVCRYESEPFVADIYKLLNDADHKFYEIHKLELVISKLKFLIDKYETIEHISENEN